MDVSDSTIRLYFSSQTPSIWNWQEGGEVVAWSNGATIAFRPEVATVLRRLVSIGWPRFGAIALLLGACRDNWDETAVGKSVLRDFLGYFHEPNHVYQLVVDTMEGLERVHALREKVKWQGQKAELAAFLFENAPHRLTPAESRDLLPAIENGFSSDQLKAWEYVSESLLADLGTLRDGLKNLDAEELERRLRTGLEQAPEAAPVDIPPGEAVRALMRQWENDDKLGGVLRLARLLLAAVQLPRPLADPEELPLGGITDISNRGPLDRLLLSELAHEDLTLAVRVALNEALYFRREPLARPRPRTRIVVLDSGIRMWGIPRVFAAAVGMAVAAQATDKLEVKVYRADGPRLVPIDFTTTKGLTDHLAALDTRLHPAECLKELVQQAGDAPRAAEVMLVTGDDVLEDNDFSVALEQARFDSLFIGTVNRQGAFRLIRRSARGSSVLKEARFALDSVFASRPKPRVPLANRSANLDRMPAIAGVDPFPLRVPVQVTVDNSWHVGEFGVLTFTSDGRLLHWDKPTLGPKQVAESLPQGKLQWCTSSVRSDFVTLVIGKRSRQGAYVMRFNHRTGDRSVHRLELSRDHPRYFFERDNIVFALFDGSNVVNACDARTGRLLDIYCLDNSTNKLHGRFCKQNGDWFAISFDGDRIGLTPVTSAKTTPVTLTHMFDAERCEGGPVGITYDHRLYFTGSGTMRLIAQRRQSDITQVAGISRDGMRVAFYEDKAVRSRNLLLAEVATDVNLKIMMPPQSAVELPLLTSTKLRLIRRKFTGVALDDSFRLAIVSRARQLWPLTFDVKSSAIVLSKKPAPSNTVATIRNADTSSSGPDYSLRVASWPDGSRAILDSRGLLHLASSNRNIPECSIVLVEGPTSGWCSDGRCWGEPYFLGAVPSRPAAEIYRDVIRPFIDHLP